MIRPMLRPMIRPMIRTMIGGLSGAIKKVFINLESTASAHYSLASPWVAAADFEVEVDYQTSDLSTILALLGGGVTGDFIRLKGNGTQVDYRVNNTVYTSDAFTEDTKLNTLRMVRTGTTVTLFRNNVLIDTQSTVLVDFTVEEVGARASLNYFDGIISNVKLTDITTPANTLEYGLDNLVANTETSNGNVLTYNNIATTTDVRDTYTLVNGDWLGSELIVNGDFATDSDWVKGTGWSIASGSANIAGNTFSNLTQSIGNLQNVPVEVTFTISNYASGTINVFIGDSSGKGLTRSANGTYTEAITTSSGSGNLFFQTGGGAGFTGSIDNVSVKRLIQVAP